MKKGVSSAAHTRAHVILSAPPPPPPRGTNSMVRQNFHFSAQLKWNSRFSEMKEAIFKTENHCPYCPLRTVGDCEIVPVESARNLGAMFDKHVTMDDQVKNACRSTASALRSFGQIKHYLTNEATKTLIHLMVTSRLDYNNSLLFGVPQRNLQKLQMLQNAAARLVTWTPRRCHTSQILQDLHWLTVKNRIQFKLVLLTY